MVCDHADCIPVRIARSMPRPDLQLRFGAFQLDEGNARLSRDGQPVALPPKAFAVLCALAREPGQLVRKGDLLDAVWGHRHVSESVLKTTISELRAALDDDARQPRYIETASRHGYRFIGLADAAPSTPPSDAPALVGRVAALERLHAAWRAAAAGQRQVFWIAGEAGIGKTTLIDRFAGGLGAAVVHGQCVEQTGAGEPYLPILEALGEMARKDPALVELMRGVAPTWLVQLPWLSSEAERNTLARELAGSGPQRMLRELAELFDRHTRDKPLLLVTEDLHWSDHATVRLIDFLARRRTPARLMWLASFRLAEIISEDHPLKSLRHELKLHRLCEEIVLDPFSESEVADYVNRRFPGIELSEEVVRYLYAHTDGLPLFVVNVLDELESRGDAASLAQGRIAGLQVPENLAGVIEKQIARLSGETRAILEAASVCGVEFRPATVAEALGHDAAWVASCCEDLVRQQHWLGSATVSARADGALDARYAFRHALYRNVFYQRIGALARAQLHRGVARALEAQPGTAPAELALHYERSHETASALKHYARAAAGALRQFAPTEAVRLTDHALSLIAGLPENEERLRLELALVTPRAAACTQLLGVSSPEATAAFERASSLCDLLPNSGASALELSGVGWVHFSRGEFERSRGLAERILGLARSQGNALLEVAAGNLLGANLTHQGELPAARARLDEAIALFESIKAQAAALPIVIDLGVSAQGRLAHVLSHAGEIESARATANAALARAEALGQPFARMLALFYVGVVEVRAGGSARVREVGEAMRKVVTDNAFVQGDPLWRWLVGWSLVERGEPAAGLPLLVEGYRLHVRIGLISGASSVLAYAALAALHANELAEAERHIEEGFALARNTGERLFLPDLMLARGRLESSRGNFAAARTAMQGALAEARRQSAAWPELEAQAALCELPEAPAADRRALGELCAARREGRDTLLFQKALSLAA
jgi:DNA-binding winged helix-turn-helix (wHTH) protein/tetratricopeptide (TPR) repeat protein